MHHWTAVAPVGTEKAAALTETYGGANEIHKHISHLFLSHSGRSHYHKISFYAMVNAASNCREISAHKMWPLAEL